MREARGEISEAALGFRCKQDHRAHEPPSSHPTDATVPREPTSGHRDKGKEHGSGAKARNFRACHM